MLEYDWRLSFVLRLDLIMSNISIHLRDYRLFRLKSVVVYNRLSFEWNSDEMMRHVKGFLRYCSSFDWQFFFFVYRLIMINQFTKFTYWFCCIVKFFFGEFEESDLIMVWFTSINDSNVIYFEVLSGSLRGLIDSNMKFLSLGRIIHHRRKEEDEKKDIKFPHA